MKKSKPIGNSENQIDHHGRKLYFWKQFYQEVFDRNRVPKKLHNQLAEFRFKPDQNSLQLETKQNAI